MTKAFSEREKELVRARLFQEACRLFAAFGFNKTSVEDLTQAASISKGAFYTFFSSKEELFMEVIESSENDFRAQIFNEIRQPLAGETPRSRLQHIFLQAFTLWKFTPVLKLISRADYDRILLKLPPESLDEHLEGDRAFIRQFIEECRRQGIEIVIDAPVLYGLVNSIFFVSLHEDDFGQDIFAGTIEVLADLIAAYCLGEAKPH